MACKAHVLYAGFDSVTSRLVGSLLYAQAGPAATGACPPRRLSGSPATRYYAVRADLFVGSAVPLLRVFRQVDALCKSRLARIPTLVLFSGDTRFHPPLDVEDRVN